MHRVLKSSASSTVVNSDHSGWSIPSESQRRENLKRFSAMSIDWTVVPRILMPALARPTARLLGVCPPTLITTPSGFSYLQISMMSSSDNSSKYKRSDSS
jgi:hypothetical protein